MKTINQENLNELPFPQDELSSLISSVVEGLDTGSLEINKNSISTENIFYNTTGQNFEYGFSIKIGVQRNESHELDIFIDNITIYETPDEWLDTFNRIKEQKL